MANGLYIYKYDVWRMMYDVWYIILITKYRACPNKMITWSKMKVTREHENSWRNICWYTTGQSRSIIQHIDKANWIGVIDGPTAQTKSAGNWAPRLTQTSQRIPRLNASTSYVELWQGSGENKLYKPDDRRRLFPTLSAEAEETFI